jgi:hypothetical protein
VNVKEVIKELKKLDPETRVYAESETCLWVFTERDIHLVKPKEEQREFVVLGYTHD